ncbi:tape measure protein [Pseudomonas sp. WS 5413]|uniref:tape measure protein n=1 Tax=Pseudomonas sp. WS 5413 TaxID=2717488 RepID=UPI0014750D8D|nr:tape measure protein [Pseudomonas sp. WS 5413]NMX34749.1 tape measure protein [Pseudomonas sp. WS 5413]
MLEKEIAKLYGTLQFKADYKPLLVFKQQIVKTDGELKRLAKSLDMVQAKIKSLGSGSSIANATKLFQAQQAAALKNGKLFATLETQRLAAIKREAEARKKVDSADTSAAKNQLAIRREAARLAEAQRLTARRDQIHGIRTTQAQARLLAIQAAEEHRHNSRQSQLQRTQQRLHTNVSNGHQGITSGLTSLAASSGFGGGIGGGLTSFASNLSTGSMVVSGFSALVIAAGAALKGFADAATERTESRVNTRFQFRALDENDPEVGKVQESRFYKLMNYLGMSAKDAAADYVKSQLALAGSGMTTDESADVLEGTLSMAKATGSSTATNSLVLKAITQMASKGQIMAEELKNQLGDSLPGAMKYAAEAYSNVSKNGKTGQDAIAALMKDMELGKIKGAMVKPVLLELGRILKANANLGGRLDNARQSHSSSLNRRQNIYDENYESSFFAGTSLTGKVGALATARKDLDRHMEYLAEDLKGIMDKAGEKAGHLLEYLTLGVDALDRLIQLGGGNKGAFDDLFSSKEDIENFHVLVDQISGLFDNIGVAIDKISEVTGAVGFSPEFKSTLQEVEAISNAIAKAWSFITSKIDRATKVRDQKVMEDKAVGKETGVLAKNIITAKAALGFGSEPKDMDNADYQSMLDQRPKTFASGVADALGDPALFSNMASLNATPSMQLGSIREGMFATQMERTKQRTTEAKPNATNDRPVEPIIYKVNVEPAQITITGVSDPMAVSKLVDAQLADHWNRSIAKLSANQKEVE